MALGAINGVASAVALPALSGILPGLVKAAELPQANAASGIARSTGTLLGGVVAGVIVGRAGWAIANAALGLGFLIGGFVVLRVKPRRPLRFGLIGVQLLVPALLCLALAPQLLLLAVAAIGVGLGFQAISVGVDTALGQHISLDKLSRVASYVMLASYAAMPIAQVAVGSLAAAGNPRSVEIVAAATFSLVLLLALCVPAVRNLPRLDSDV